MKSFRGCLSTIILLGLFVFCFIYRVEIVTYVMSTVNDYTKVASPNENDYSNDFKFEFVHLTDDFHVDNKQDILNVIYTFLDSGQNEFTFYCSSDYESCEDELKMVSDDQALLSVINNMVSPYNSYERLYVTINNYGKVIIEVDKLYSEKEITYSNDKILEITNKIINDNMSLEDKIKAYHDYLGNNTIYDEERAERIEHGTENESTYNSHKAVGPLLEGYALCSGYSDAMKIFLDQLGVPNYKISNDEHIWNLIYIDGKWLHLDLTWDDPVTVDGSNLLLHKFFLIDTNTLLSLDKESHGFNTDYYPELK